MKKQNWRKLVATSLTVMLIPSLPAPAFAIEGQQPDSETVVIAPDMQEQEQTQVEQPEDPTNPQDRLDTQEDVNGEIPNMDSETTTPQVDSEENTGSSSIPDTDTQKNSSVEQVTLEPAVVPMEILTSAMMEADTTQYEYMGTDGKMYPCTGTIIKIDTDTKEWANSEAWYVVNEDVTINTRIEVNGNIKLLLTDNCTLTAQQGIHVGEDNSLTINAESDGETMGVLNANIQLSVSEFGNASIGGNHKEVGGNITINGGKVIANASSGGAGGESDGNITISGGTVKAETGMQKQFIGQNRMIL